jgi:polysaccharide biosynthesis transport protein
VIRRIRRIEMEKDRKPRISLESKADVRNYEDKRIKLAAGVAFGSLGLGCLLAFLRDKADKRLKVPDDVSKQAHLPLIGTITSSNAVKPALFAEQIAQDYQFIRTNLGMLGSEGIPRRLTVTSACSQEGKTTFSVNLATSLAKAGKRVLLIDGDLRKPDVTNVLDLTSISKQPSDRAGGGGLEGSMWTVPSTGLDVLVPDSRQIGDPYELIASPLVAQRIAIMSQSYDHIIIDGPPVLAFPDASIWARITGHAILVCFAWRTTEPNLTEAKTRILQSHARLLGVVMNNVDLSHGYQRYVDGYYGKRYGSEGKRKRDAKRLLLSLDAPNGSKGKGKKKGSRRLKVEV